MRRRGFLSLLSVTALAALRCGGGDDSQAVVRVGNLGSAPTPLPTIGPSPTPTPPPVLDLSIDRVFQGGAVLVSLVGETKDGSLTFLGRKQPLTKGARSIYAFVGIDVEAPPGTHQLRADFTLAAGTQGSLTHDITVVANTWTADSVNVPAAVAAVLLDPKLQERELAVLNDVYSKVTPEKLWEEGWTMPTGGDVTTRFGEERSYNGGPPVGHHYGTDLGAPEGTPVAVTNNGRVVLARQLQLRGNTVVVDHGGGLFSGYAHLKSFNVAEGEQLLGGDTVGHVGSSGLSTGAHLHWEVAAGGVLVDALRFTDGSNGF